MGDCSGNARPVLPKFVTNDMANDKIHWDFYFTDFDPAFWPAMFSEQPSHEGVGHDSDTGSEWIQFHGSNVYACLSAIGANCLSRSESVAALQAGEEAEMSQKDLKEAKLKCSKKIGFETEGAGRGVYTSQDFHKALAYAVPMWVDEAKCSVKVVMTVRRLDNGQRSVLKSGMI